MSQKEEPSCSDGRQFRHCRRAITWLADWTRHKDSRAQQGRQRPTAAADKCSVRHDSEHFRSGRNRSRSDRFGIL